MGRCHLIPDLKVNIAMPQKLIGISTRGQGLYDFTDAALAFVRSVDPEEGLLTVFVRHTSCSLLIQENADPDVQRDLKTFFCAHGAAVQRSIDGLGCPHCRRS